MKQMLSFFHIGKHVISIKTAVLGYKVSYDEYSDINLLLSYMFYSIYKATYLTNMKENKIDVVRIFQEEIENAVLI